MVQFPDYVLFVYDKEKNTLKSTEIQRGLHAISILIIILFLLMTLKPTMVGPFDQPSLEPAMILAWFNPLIPCSLSNDKEKNTDKICMMMTRLACNRAIESSYWRMDNNSDVGLLTGYVLYQLPIEQESMDLDTFSH
jgi:hypothetical protein